MNTMRDWFADAWKYVVLPASQSRTVWGILFVGSGTAGVFVDPGLFAFTIGAGTGAIANEITRSTRRRYERDHWRAVAQEPDIVEQAQERRRQAQITKAAVLLEEQRIHREKRQQARDADHWDWERSYLESIPGYLPVSWSSVEPLCRCRRQTRDHTWEWHAWPLDMNETRRIGRGTSW